MGAKRKALRRGRKGRALAPPSGETASVRFRKPGSEKLWTALLGLSGAGLVRVWLLDAIADAAAEGKRGRDAVEAFAARRPDLADRLVTSDFDAAVSLWADAASGSRAHLHYVAELVGRLGLGSVSAEQLAEDHRIWTGLAGAAPAHKELLDALARAEQAALRLHAATRSEPVLGVLTTLRTLWAAAAYGDASTLAHVAALAREFPAPTAMTRP